MPPRHTTSHDTRHTAPKHDVVPQKHDDKVVELQAAVVTLKRFLALYHSDSRPATDESTVQE